MGINIMLMELGDVHSGILHSFHLFPFQTVSLPAANILLFSHKCKYTDMNKSLFYS